MYVFSNIKSKRNGPLNDNDLVFTEAPLQCRCQKIRSVFRILGMYNFGWGYKRKLMQGLTLSDLRSNLNAKT